MEELILRTPTDEEFHNWFEDSCREFADDTAFINKSDPEKEYKEIIEKTNELLPNGKDSPGTVIKVFDTDTITNGGFVWFGKLEPLKDDDIFLYQITISKDHRGKGFGRKLLHQMHQVLSKMGYKQVYLNVMKRNYAKDLYLSLGYKIANEYEHNYILSIKI